MSNPCNFSPCSETPEVLVDDILLETARRVYEPDIYVSKNQELKISTQITKTKELKVEANSTLEFDLDNKFDYYIIVAKKVVIVGDTSAKFELTFKWRRDNLRDLYKRLKGKDGSLAPSPAAGNNGLDGLPGETGKKGGTRHSPAIFLFFEELDVQKPELPNISFHFDLKGIPGGVGGTGGNGSNGNKGKRGSNGDLGGLFEACSKGKKGRKGGNPGFGGRGGDGGCGGNGPQLKLFYTNQDFQQIFERSKYNLEGADMIFYGEGHIGWGMPGDAGREGPGGRGGKRAGNCGPGSRGDSGQPKYGTYEWENYNLGHGLPGTAGKSGYYDYNIIDSFTKVVFEDPSNPTVEKLEEFLNEID